MQFLSERLLAGLVTRRHPQVALGLVLRAHQKPQTSLLSLRSSLPGPNVTDGVGSRVVSKFRHGKEIRPFFRFVGGEQPQVHFQFLIYSFGFPISLGVICSGEGDVVLKEAGEFSGKGQGKLWSSVRDHL